MLPGAHLSGTFHGPQGMVYPDGNRNQLEPSRWPAELNRRLDVSVNRPSLCWLSHTPEPGTCHHLKPSSEAQLVLARVTPSSSGTLQP